MQQLEALVFVLLCAVGCARGGDGSPLSDSLVRVSRRVIENQSKVKLSA